MEQNIPYGALNGYLYTHWAEELKTQLSERTGEHICFIQHYEQHRVEVSGPYVYYTFRIIAGEDEDHYDGFNVTVKIDFYHDRILLVKVLSYTDNSWMETRYGIRTDQNLIPDLHNNKLREEEAERFLKKYCPEALETPMPVPIRKIMEEQMDLRIETGFDIPGHNKYAFTTMESDIHRVIDEDGREIAWYFDWGTVIVDSYSILLYGLGVMNYSLGHEAYHWFAHRPYEAFHKLIGKQGDKSYNGSSRYGAGEILEIQANAMSSWILMPKKPFIQKFKEYKKESADIHEVISALARFFKVSYSAATYRLDSLGLADYSKPAETDNVTAADSYELYAQEDFRKLVDSGQVVYTGGHYVIDDPKYVTCSWGDVPRYNIGRDGGPYQLTDYALAHPDEAFIRFTIDHRRIAGDVEEGVLYRSSEEYLKAEVEAFKKRYPKDALRIGAHVSKFKELFEEVEGAHPTFCQLSQLLILYRYGSEEAFQEKATSREWMPDREMPEMYEEYFSVNQFVRKLEKMRDDIWDSDVDLETTKIVEQLCTEEITKEKATDKETENRFRDNLTIRKYEDDRNRIAEKASSPVQLFIADTHQPRTFYNDIMNGKKNNPEPNRLMCLCVGMCLSPILSADLFAAAGRVLTWDKENFAYRYILTHMRGAYIHEVNAFLDNLGLDLIGSNTGKKNESTI